MSVTQACTERSHAWRCRGSQGFTLLELMIALVVLTIGMLGLATMQGMALKATASGGNITIANNLVRNAAERIVKNSANSGAYAGMNTSSGSRPNCPNLTPAPVCATDLTDWQLKVTGLPQGLLRVTSTAGATFDTVTVIGSWQDSMGQHSVTLPFQVAP